MKVTAVILWILAAVFLIFGAVGLLLFGGHGREIGYVALTFPLALVAGVFLLRWARKLSRSGPSQHVA